ncbi:hypothetical protein TWF694_007189 [Orbilia ellipsospora]|uniref:Uncharacterized protein n=1 Tax=Orbilia ellipsospora TaxID=2528407 RepID=A0AAV9XIF8_9PEZI
MRKRSQNNATASLVAPQDQHESLFRASQKPDAGVKDFVSFGGLLDTSTSVWKYCSSKHKPSTTSLKHKWVLTNHAIRKSRGENTVDTERARSKTRTASRDHCRSRSRPVYLAQAPVSRLRARSLSRLRVRSQRKRFLKKEKLNFVSQSRQSLRRIISIPKLSKSKTSVVEQRYSDDDCTRKYGRNRGHTEGAQGGSTSATSGDRLAKSSSQKESPQDTRRRSSQNFKRRKKIPDEFSDGEDEDVGNTSRSANRSSSSKEYACPFFKAYPSLHMSCRDSGWIERRKVKDHLKRYHYNGNAPSEIQHSHAWDDWYRYIVKDTDRESRAIPNSDPNFVKILCFLLRASEELEGQEAPCFGTRMLKLLQHAQRNPTETEYIIRGISAILDRPYESVSIGPETFSSDISTLPPNFESRLHNPELQFVPESVYSPLHWPTSGEGSIPIASALSEATIPNPEHATNFGDTNSQYLVLTAAPACNEPRQGAEVWQLTPIVAHSSPDANDNIGEWVRSGDHVFNPTAFNATVNELIVISQDTPCENVRARNRETSIIHADPESGFSLQDLGITIQPPDGFVDPKQMQISKIESLPCATEHPNTSLGGISPTQFFAKVSPNSNDAMPAPAFVQPCRRLKDMKRKRPRAESVENILIPTYDSRFSALPTPSPSVLSKAGSSALMTPSLLTPFTANTTCSNSSFSASTHMILVISDRRPEMFKFTGSIANSIDDFIDWISFNFGFNFSDFTREFWFMNDGIPLYNKKAVLAQLEDFWDESGDMFFNKAIPWFWIDVPCRCFTSRPTRPTAELRLSKEAFFFDSADGIF